MFSDPHEFLHSSKHWTHNGYEKNLYLRVMCQVNNAIYEMSLLNFGFDHDYKNLVFYSLVFNFLEGWALLHDCPVSK